MRCKWAEFKRELVVEEEFYEAVVGAQTDFPHAEVTANRIQRRGIGRQGDLQCVEKGVGWRPQRRGGEIEEKISARRASGRGNLIGAGKSDRANAQSIGRAVDGHVDLETLLVNIRHQVEAADARWRHRFQPDGLPDARGRGEHDARGIERLFAARLAAVVLRAEHLHDQFLGAAVSQVGSDVVTEGIVTAGVNPHALSVQVNLRPPIDRLKM